MLLVVGAGGGFGRVLDEAGVAQAIADASPALPSRRCCSDGSLAALLRVAVGSATVAITTSASILAPVAAATPGTDAALLVIAMGAGSIFASHVNDGGFWLVKEYFNLTRRRRRCDRGPCSRRSCPSSPWCSCCCSMPILAIWRG